MDFFVISDIHGSSLALKKALHIYNNGNFDKILICGDILYHGARNPLPEGYNPKEVIELLNNIKKDIIAVRGNCESEVDSMVLEFPITADYSYMFNGLREVFITHGHVYSCEKLPPLSNGSIFLYGHTHIPAAEFYENIFHFNPGSISLPKNNFKASYGILSNNFWEVRELDSKNCILRCDLP